MTSTIQFERPGFDEIATVIRRIFPVVDSPEFGLLPDSIDRYLTAGGVPVLWQRIPDWESYACGQRDISSEEFVSLLFSPLCPGFDENVLCVTDECFETRRGFSFRFTEILPFARDVYSQVVTRPTSLFQPCDMIFVAEQSRLLVMLHHEGYRTQVTA